MSYFYVPCMEDGDPTCVYANTSDGFSDKKDCLDPNSNPNIKMPSCRKEPSESCLVDCSDYNPTQPNPNCQWASCNDATGKKAITKAMIDSTGNMPTYPTKAEAEVEDPYDLCSNYRPCVQTSESYSGLYLPGQYYQMGGYVTMNRTWKIQKDYQL